MNPRKSRAANKIIAKEADVEAALGKQFGRTIKVQYGCLPEGTYARCLHRMAAVSTPTPVASLAGQTVTALHTPPLTLRLPNGEVLLADTPLHIAPGDSVLIRGPSGCGKSTLMRVLAGIWPAVSSASADGLPVALPQGSLFMPQRPYFPEGSLRQALTYPDAQVHHSDEELQQALRDALLPQLVNQLDTEGRWTQLLSGGEQQRLSMARVLLKRPRWVFADEATSALDEAAETALYQQLQALVQAQGGALVSIAHRPGVAAFHQTQWVFTPAPEGSVAKYVLT